MRIALLALLMTGCVAAADVPLMPRDPLPCDADPEAPRSRLPSHPSLLDPEAPRRVERALGEGSARTLTREGAAVVEWRTRADLTGLSPDAAGSLVRQALRAIGVDDVELAGWSAWRAGDGAAVQAEQAWRHLRVDAVRFFASDGTPGNESTLRIGPLLDFAPAERPAVSEGRAARIAERFLACAREAMGADPDGETVREGLTLDGATLAWSIQVGAAGPSCAWPDRALVDAFTGAVVWAGPSCMT